MFDFAWSEIAVLGVIALVVIGPKDLPRALKTAGFMVRRARMMAREFQNSVDDMIRESELHDIRETAAKAAGVDDLKQAMQDAMDTTSDIRTAIAEPLGGGPTAHEPVTPLTVEGTAIAAPPVEPAAPAATQDHPAPAEHAPADLHRTPPAP
jgi:sec-independent protein translocase protein TatB